MEDKLFNVFTIFMISLWVKVLPELGILEIDIIQASS